MKPGQPFADLPTLAAHLRGELENKKTILLYAYNGTGKTRLSMEFKAIGKQGEARDTLYFNAFTEDLFHWDNDLDGDSDRKLTINSDSRFFAGLAELEMDNRIRPLLQRYADFDFRIDTQEWAVRFSRTVDGLVIDNIKVGRHHLMNKGFLAGGLYWLGGAQKEELAHRREVEEIIDFLEIQHIRKTPVGRLPYGLQKRVELGRALAAEPSMLLLDEPMAGMNVEEKQDMCRFILDVNDQFGTTVVLIEHDMGVVMDISDRVVVLDYGKKIGDGTPDEVRANPEVISAYLGASH